MKRFILVALLLLCAVPSAEAACTEGTDCYCDRVASGSGDPIADANLLKCYDFDDEGLYLNPASNNWASGTASPPNHNRGADSRWQNAYGQPVQQIWPDGEPASPYVGSVCDVPTFSNCVGAIEYCSEGQGDDAGIDTGGGVGVNCWGSASFDANAIAVMDIQKLSNLDYKHEVTDLLGPTYEAAHSNYHMAMRVPVGITGGLLDDGSKSSFNTTELGITLMVAYANNLESSGILKNPWKADEMETTPTTFTNNQFPMATTGGCIDEANGLMQQRFPFCPYFASRGVNSCSSISATQTLGTVACEGGGGEFIRFNADLGSWDSATDLPFDEWICVRGHIEGYHTTDTRVRVWVTTSELTDQLVLDIDAFDTSAGGNSEVPDAFTTYQLNNYANINVAGGDDTVETTFRHEDNIHIRAGAPVSCDQVGFVAGASASASLSGGTLSGGSIQ